MKNKGFIQVKLLNIYDGIFFPELLIQDQLGVEYLTGSGKLQIQ